MSKTTLTYSHCRPISYYTYDSDGHCPALMREAYIIANELNHDTSNQYEEYNPNEFLTLILIPFADDTYGVLDCITVNKDHNMDFYCSMHEEDTLRVFPDKAIALRYMDKYIETVRSVV